MADIILIKPSSGWMDKIKTSLDIPLSILYASILANQKYTIKVIDEEIEKDWKQAIENELKNSPLLVGITTMTGEQIKHALKISRFIKQLSPNVKIVWGGVHPTIMPVQTISDPSIDIVVEGEGEETLLELADALKHSKTLKKVRGICYKENNKITCTGARAYIDLNKLPLPPYKILEMKKYLPTYFGKKTINMESSRGCPFRCTFCRNNIDKEKKKWRPFNEESMMKHIRHLVKTYGIEAIHFQDENFFIDLKRARNIITQMKKEFPHLHWLVNSIRIDTLDRMDDEYLRFLEQSSCIQLKIGVESGSDRILQMIKKDINVEQIMKVNKRLAKFSMKALYNFMCGFPSETKDDIKKTINLIFQLKKENKNAASSAVNIYTPYPGTEMYEEVKRLGFKEPKNLDEWAEHSFESVKPTWLPKKQQKIVENIYFTSLFLTDYDKEFLGSNWMKLAMNCYKPIARIRIKNLFFPLMLEKKIKDKILKIYE